MSGTAEYTENHGNDVDVAAAITSPCISPLHAIPGFTKLSGRKLCPKGSVLLVEGQTAPGVYVLCSGRAKLSITSAEGKTLIVRIARPGDMLGIHSALTGSACEATAQTLVASQVDFVSRRDLSTLLDRQKPGDCGLAIALSEDFIAFIEQARILALSGSALERVARLLLRLGDEFGKPTKSGIQLKTFLTHEEVAQMIGSSRETVTRAFNILERKRLILVKNGDLVIRNRRAMKSL